MLYKKIFAIIAMASAFSAFAMEREEVERTVQEPTFFVTTVSNQMSGRASITLPGATPGLIKPGKEGAINNSAKSVEINTAAEHTFIQAVGNHQIQIKATPWDFNQQTRGQIIPDGKAKIIINSAGSVAVVPVK